MPLNCKTAEAKPEKVFYFACWLFLRLLGICYFFAFLSLSQQIIGLIGNDGILPLQTTMHRFAHGKSLLPAFFTHPTLFWLNSSDFFLELISSGGVAAALLITLGIAGGPALLLAWIFYLSISNAAGVFLQFQWDRLLMEVGFFALFLAPWRKIELPWAKTSYSYSKWSLRLLRWVLFRLMFCSGLVKIWCDPCWRNFTALYYHYETQPLPNTISWYAYQLPHWFQRFSAGSMFVIELVVPFFIFGPRQLKLAAAIIWCIFQGLIFLTGNYGYFNLLSAALAVLLVDDAAFERLIPKILRRQFDVQPKQRAESLKQTNVRVLRGLFAYIRLLAKSPGVPHLCSRRILTKSLLIGSTALIVLLGIVQFWQKWRGTYGISKVPVIPKVLRTTITCLRPYHIIGNYGLFWVMNKRRPELILQGSNDLHEWKTYEFKYKPGDLQNAPPCTGLFLPRLDWWVTFAALDSNRPDKLWFKRFIVKLFECSPAVLNLLANNPFPSGAPAYVRANLYIYHFTSYAERNLTGNWWKRSLIRTWFYSKNDAVPARRYALD